MSVDGAAVHRGTLDLLPAATAASQRTNRPTADLPTYRGPTVLEQHAVAAPPICRHNKRVRRSHGDLSETARRLVDRIPASVRARIAAL